MGTPTATIKWFLLTLACLLLISWVPANAKRTSSRGRRSSSNLSLSTSHVSPSIDGSSIGSADGPAYSHSDIAKLSYGGDTHSQRVVRSASRAIKVKRVRRPTSPKFERVMRTTTRTLKKKRRRRPTISSSSNTGLGGSNNAETPIRATKVQGVQSINPRQEVPAGASYYASGSQLPAGATYHSPGALPAGAIYHPGGSLPAGATYHPSGALLTGASYHPPGAVPAGPIYYPAAAALPPGATFVPAGAVLPAGATYYAQPPVESSSGPGFGSGLAVGALGGAILGHALTPTHTNVVKHVPVSNGGGGGGGSSSGNKDHIIIINNGPPGSVTTTDAGSGTTVINTSGGAPVAQLATTSAPQPAVPAITKLTPLSPVNPEPNAAAMGTVAAGATVAMGAATVAAMPAGAVVPTTGVTPAEGVAPAGPGIVPVEPVIAPAPEQPPAGGIICVPVRVNEPDPADSTKTIEVEQIACYPAPPPEATAPVTPILAAAGEAASSTGSPLVSASTAAPLMPIHEASVVAAPLAPLNAQPVHVPGGLVQLAPFDPSQPSNIMQQIN